MASVSAGADPVTTIVPQTLQSVYGLPDNETFEVCSCLCLFWLVFGFVFVWCLCLCCGVSFDAGIGCCVVNAKLALGCSCVECFWFLRYKICVAPLADGFAVS